jgi:hypothetical protein
MLRRHFNGAAEAPTDDGPAWGCLLSGYDSRRYGYERRQASVVGAFHQEQGRHQAYAPLDETEASPFKEYTRGAHEPTESPNVVRVSRSVLREAGGDCVKKM